MKEKEKQHMLFLLNMQGLVMNQRLLHQLRRLAILIKNRYLHGIRIFTAKRSLIAGMRTVEAKK